MSTVVGAPLPQRGLVGRPWAALVGAWGVVAGIVPHVLHHVGPLAGAALLAGFGGKALFFVLGLLLSLPLLRRLYRRFGGLVAPAVAGAVFAPMFTLSSVVIAPRLTDSERPPAPAIEQPSEHAGHHGGGAK
jgi:hypothetical protein